MTPREFLTTVLPGSGRYCVASQAPGKRGFRHVFVDTINAVMTAAGQIPEGHNAYFACSTYGDNRNKYGRIARSQNNTVKTKSLWLDIDTGEGKKYPTIPDALLALRGFCRELKLPKPIVVNSGGGIHVYWPLKESLSFEPWFKVASKLKAVCLVKGLGIDPTCTSDSARVLRIPGTTNYKYDPVVPVVILSADAGVVDVYDFAKRLAVVETDEEDAPARLPFAVPAYIKGVDDMTRSLVGENPESVFSVIVARRDCAQITHIVENQNDIPEPLWRAGLSIAQACSDRDTAIHLMSKEHKKYSPEETEAKARSTVGPMSCIYFEQENPGGCDGCKFKGKIKSPISLGKQVEVSDNKPTKVVTKSEDGVEQTHSIPPYPHPYVRGKDGSVVLSLPPEEGGRKTIYPHPFYIVKRMVDPHEGESLWAKLHLPHDGVKEFPIPLRDASAADRFRDVVSTQGVAVFGPTLDRLRHYVLRWAQELQLKQKAEIMRDQFGWTNEDTFVIGEREIRKDGIFYSPPARSVANVSAMLTKKGSLEGWKRVVNIYDTPGIENRAFALFAGFGAPLMRFTALKGGIINLTSPTSGEGKTTVQLTINSIWGHPDRLKLEKSDTQNARIHRMGVMNNLPVTIDEVTNMPAIQASELLYASTSGRGKNRMEQSANAERLNNTSWCTIVVTSANSSFEDKIRSLKMSAEGELMRLIEIPVRRQYVNTKEYTDKLFGSLNDNYGIAGEIYAQYLVRNVDAVRELLDETQRKIDAQSGLTQKERVWSAIAAAAITGGKIAKNLGLHNIDVDRVAEWVKGHLRETRSDTTETTTSMGISALGTFLDSHQHNTLIINNTRKNNLPNSPIVENTRELFVRIEPDTQYVYISAARLRQWCAENQVPYTALLREIESAGVEVESTTKRLAAGTPWTSSPVRSVRLLDKNKVVLDTENTTRPNLSVVGDEDDAAAR